MAGQNVALAFTNGTIAYRLAAAVPKRTHDGRIARDGAFSDAAWSGYLPIEKRPKLDNPKRGFIVAANQRIIESTHPAIRSVGTLGGPANRARRITERIEDALATKKVSADELLSIQQDAVSVEARAIGAILAKHCPSAIPPHARTVATAFCAAVTRFDGEYRADSTDAMAYTRYVEAFKDALVVHHLGAKRAVAVRKRPFVRTIMVDALREGDRSPVFDGEGIAHFASVAATQALTRIVDEHGDDPSDWVWGAAHGLTISGPLAKAAVIGGFWAIDRGPQSGHKNAPRAEYGSPIRGGAAFRMVAEMSTPPKVRMIIDTGNSGHPGHRHWDDMSERWMRGEPLTIPIERAAVERIEEGRIELRPAP